MTAAEYLTRVEAAAAAATEGPWTDGMGTHGNPADGPDFCEVRAPKADPVPHWPSTFVIAELDLCDRGGRDAAFIAAARDAVPRMAAALRAVLALHRPQQVATSASSDPAHVPTIVTRCECQPYWLGYPCPTVAAITAALDGEING